MLKSLPLHDITRARSLSLSLSLFSLFLYRCLPRAKFPNTAPIASPACSKIFSWGMDSLPPHSMRVTDHRVTLDSTRCVAYRLRVQ